VYVPTGYNLNARLMLRDSRGKQEYGAWHPSAGGGWTQLSMPNAHVDPGYMITKASVQFVTPAGAPNYTGSVWVDHILVRGTVDRLTDSASKTAASLNYSWDTAQTTASGPDVGPTTTTYTYDAAGEVTDINPPPPDDIGNVTTEPEDPPGTILGDPLPEPPPADAGAPTPASEAPPGYFAPESEPELQYSVMASSPYYGYRARDYARKWRFSYNPDYQFFGCNDCTNFLSQALRAGGWKFKGAYYDRYSDWYYKRPCSTCAEYWSKTWTAADWMKQFLRYNPDRMNYRKYLAWVDVGDVILVDFDRDGRVTHALLVTGVEQHNLRNIWVTYHSGAGDRDGTCEGKVRRLSDFYYAGSNEHANYFVYDINGSG
jgi:hypothetical protein